MRRVRLSQKAYLVPLESSGLKVCYVASHRGGWGLSHPWGEVYGIVCTVCREGDHVGTSKQEASEAEGHLEGV